MLFRNVVKLFVVTFALAHAASALVYEIKAIRREKQEHFYKHCLRLRNIEAPEIVAEVHSGK
jgi:hypothetical protein